MEFVVSKEDVDMNLFSPCLVQNKSFANSLKISVKLMRNQWEKLNQTFKEQLEENPNFFFSSLFLPEEKEKLLHHFAKSAFFLNREITWENEKQVACEKKVCVLDILKEMNQKIIDHRLDKDKEYVALFTLVTNKN